jgi:hypothetical protein
MPLRPEVLTMLLDHGLRPRSTTPLPLLRAQLNDLYRFEIRRLKRHLQQGAFPLADYVPHVLTLRARYLLLSVPLSGWTTPAEDAVR